MVFEKTFIAIVLTVCCLESASVLAGSCRESSLCCNGRDSSCVVQKAPINAIIEDLSDKPCYCDHACLRLGDCCEDFKQYCGELVKFSTHSSKSHCRPVETPYLQPPSISPFFPKTFSPQHSSLQCRYVRYRRS
ncbi:hypothetical protein DMENIID0001_102210 [Sergentomyia squamirostris]